MSRIVSPQDIANKVGLGAKELSKPCEESLFPLLADFVHPWRLVFASLLNVIDLDDVESENTGHSEQEKRIAALHRWKTRNGNRATYELLLKAVLNSGKVDCAESMCQMLLDEQGEYGLG